MVDLYASELEVLRVVRVRCDAFTDANPRNLKERLPRDSVLRFENRSLWNRLCQRSIKTKFAVFQDTNPVIVLFLTKYCRRGDRNKETDILPLARRQLDRRPKHAMSGH